MSDKIKISQLPELETEQLSDDIIIPGSDMTNPETGPVTYGIKMGAIKEAAKDPDVVKTTPMDLTPEKQEIARENIDAATPSGYYGAAGLGAATAENLIDTKAVGVTRKFIFDTACGDASITDDGRGTIDVIKGNTILWNQGIPRSVAPILNPDFADISRKVARGIRPYLIGQELIANKGDHAISWIVRDYDRIRRADNPTAPTMVLEMKNVYGTATAYQGIQFCAMQAIYFAEEGLTAGPYCFTVKNQAWYADDNNKKYYFTLSNNVPAGGQLVLDMTYNAALEGKHIKSYSSSLSTTVIDNAVLSATPIENAVDLGATDGLTPNMNHMHRAIFGSNNYAQSAFRQWITSTETNASFWLPMTKFDRPPSWYGSSSAAYRGFASEFSEDFLNAVKVASLPCRTNSVYECDSLDGTEFAINQTYTIQDKFFALSRPEVFGSWDSTSYKDGEQLEWYKGLTQEEHIRYDEFGTARYVWLRSPTPGNARLERSVHTSGAVDYLNAYDSYAVSSACII